MSATKLLVERRQGYSAVVDCKSLSISFLVFQVSKDINNILEKFEHRVRGGRDVDPA